MQRIVAHLAEAFAAKSSLKLALFGSASQLVVRTGTVVFLAAGTASIVLVNGILVRVERRAAPAPLPALGTAKAMMAIVPPGSGDDAAAHDQAALMAWLGLDRPFSGMPFGTARDEAGSSSSGQRGKPGASPPAAFAIPPFGDPLLGQALIGLVGEIEAEAEPSSLAAELAAASTERLAFLDPGALAPLPVAATPALPDPVGDTEPVPPQEPSAPAPPQDALPPVPTQPPPLPGVGRPQLPAVPVTPVPEPATWAQLIGGAGAVAALLRRRRNRKLHAALTSR